MSALVPVEIQDEIIDHLATLVDKPGVHRPVDRREFLQLRLICQNWRRRVDVHAFKTFVMAIEDAPKVVSALAASKFAIGDLVKNLIIRRKKGPLPTFEDAALLQSYLELFILSLPYLRSLSLVGLRPMGMKLVPPFPTVRHFSFEFVWVKAHHFSRILLSTSSIESFHERGLKIGLDDTTSTYSHTLHTDISDRRGRPSLDWTNLKSFHTSLLETETVDAFTYLFSNSPKLMLPSLTHLSLWLDGTASPGSAVRLMKAACDSLRHLLISFTGDYEGNVS
jgi:hypothetical protein